MLLIDFSCSAPPIASAARATHPFGPALWHASAKRCTLVPLPVVLGVCAYALFITGVRTIPRATANSSLPVAIRQRSRLAIIVPPSRKDSVPAEAIRRTGHIFESERNGLE